MQNHPRSPKNPVIHEPVLARLLHRALRATHQKLPLPLNPEMRRKIRKIREYRDEWASWPRIRETFIYRPVEVRNERHNHVRSSFPPMPLQNAHRSGMPRPNRKLQHFHQVNAAQSPSAAQHPVVVVLDAYPRVSLQDIQLIEQLLNVEEANIPRTPLRRDGHLQGGGCRTVPAAGVEKAELDSLHERGVSHRFCRVLLRNDEKTVTVSKELNICIFRTLARMSSAGNTRRLFSQS